MKEKPQRNPREASQGIIPQGIIPQGIPERHALEEQTPGEFIPKEQTPEVMPQNEEIIRLREQNARMKELIGLLTGLAQRGEELGRQNEGLQKSIGLYRQGRAEAKMEEDLKRIRKIDPKIRSLDDLGEDYLSLVRSGIDGLAAFLAIKGMKDMAKSPLPPAIGSINAKTNEEGEFFTNSELDSLSGKDLDNPRILQKAIKSLSKL